MEIKTTAIKITHCWHYTTANAWASILESGLLKSRKLLISETLQAREDWQELKRSGEALLRVLPPYMKARHSPLRRKGVIFFSGQPYNEDQAGLLTEVKRPNCPWSRREDAKEDIPAVGMKRLFDLGNGLVRLGLPRYTFPSWNKLLDDAGVGLLEKMELRGLDQENGFYNSKFVTGIVADKIPLKAIACVEQCVPTPDGETCVWVPFLFPSVNSTIDVNDANLSMLETRAAAVAEMKDMVDRHRVPVIELGHLVCGSYLFVGTDYETMGSGIAM
jgi:hypothetical protein